VKDYLAGEATWRLPHIDKPPGGAKVLLLTPGGICVVGPWAEWAVAWAPLPRLTPEIKRLVLEAKL